jgi:phosphoribosylformylglycinamidine cyclo-ligase
MPDVYTPGEFDLAGFIVGVVEGDHIIDGSKITAGDVLIGLPSSGLHTNGFSLARKVLAIADGEPADETRRRLEERPASLGAPPSGGVARHARPVSPPGSPADRPHPRHGAHHRRRLRRKRPRILPEGSPPGSTPELARAPIFQLIQQRGEVSSEEMYEVFNMGIGMVLMVAPEDADQVLASVDGSLRIGAVTEWNGRPVELAGL